MSENPTETNQIFLNNMRKMFEEDTEDTIILGKYRVSESQVTVVSVGTRVTVRTDSGSKDCLLLRVIPIERMKSVWIFPMDYSDAEVGLITRSGSYVIQSSLMKSESFIDYITMKISDSRVFRTNMPAIAARTLLPRALT